jgi:porin
LPPRHQGLPFALLTLLVLAGPVHASDPRPFTDTLTGDWFGLRTALKDHGIDFTVVYTSETAYNPKGGQERSALYTDQLSFGFAFDLEKLLKLSDAQFQISITDRNGHNRKWYPEFRHTSAGSGTLWTRTNLADHPVLV